MNGCAKGISLSVNMGLYSNKHKNCRILWGSLIIDPIASEYIRIISPDHIWARYWVGVRYSPDYPKFWSERRSALTDDFEQMTHSGIGKGMDKNKTLNKIIQYLDS